MSYDWLGTFNKSQLDRFAEFARAQQTQILDRIAHLDAEAARVGSISMAYDGDGNPTGYSVAKPPNSYIAKLMAAYEVLGGDALYDLHLRSMSQAVYVVQSDESTAAQRMSSGEVFGETALADAPSAELVRQARGWLGDTLHYRKEYLERKIRRAIDYSDQLNAEIALLQKISRDSTVVGSIENVFAELYDLIKDKTYRAIYDDQGKDLHGLKTLSPYAPYSVGPDDTGLANDGRDLGGFQPASDDTSDPDL